MNNKRNESIKLKTFRVKENISIMKIVFISNISDEGLIKANKEFIQLNNNKNFDRKFGWALSKEIYK